MGWRAGNGKGVRQDEEYKAWLTHSLCVDWRVHSSRVGRQENLGGGERGMSAVRGEVEGRTRVQFKK